VYGWLFQPGLVSPEQQARSLWTIPRVSAIQWSDVLGPDDLLVVTKQLEIACTWTWAEQQQAKSQAV
jgi:hypothetical protein